MYVYYVFITHKWILLNIKKETKDRNCLYDKYLNIHITHRQTIRPVN